MTENSDIIPPNDTGCFVFIGSLMLSVGVGFATQEAYGWIAFGTCLLLIGLVQAFKKP